MGKGRPTRKQAQQRGPAPHKREAARRARSAAGTTIGQATDTATDPVEGTATDPATNPVAGTATNPATNPAAGTAKNTTGAARPRRAVRGLRGDELLPPRDRGPVRAYVRDVVDSRRHVLGLFMPVFAVALITTVGPASELARNLQIGSMAILALMAAEAVYLAVAISKMARAEFPDTEVSTAATGWYVFVRAHRLRSTRRPAPRVSPGRP